MDADPTDQENQNTAASRTCLPSQDVCTICLQPIWERAVLGPCNHLTFDFLCVVTWLQERAVCPLCKLTVTHVEYDWRSPSDYKTYRLPQASSEPSERPHRRQRRLSGRRTEDIASVASHDSLERRHWVYSRRLPSLHVGANDISGYRSFTPVDFLNNPGLQSRARTFLRRELEVFTFLDHKPAPRGGNRQYLVEYVVAILKSHEPKGADGKAQELLQEFLGQENAVLLLHELQSWLQSPFEVLCEWDEYVQYSHDEAKH